MIDKLALVDPQAKIAKDVKIGPYTIIGPDVEIDAGTIVGPHVVITGKTKIGKNNKIYQFASIGEEPQSWGYKGEPTTVEIGDNNIIREYCSIHRGTVEGRETTKIGNNNFLMAYVHIAHDCLLGDKIVLANNATLAGHVTVADSAIFGGFVVVSQFCEIGAFCFIVGTTAINKNVLPYTLVSAHNETNKRKSFGLNLVGLKRNGFSTETIQKLKQAYGIIFQEDLLKEQIVEKLEAMIADCPEVKLLADAIKQSNRGFVH